MISHFLHFKLQKLDDVARIKPGEIVSIMPSPDGGSRIVTRQQQVFYVLELPEIVETMIFNFFEKINEGRSPLV